MKDPLLKEVKLDPLIDLHWKDSMSHESCTEGLFWGFDEDVKQRGKKDVDDFALQSSPLSLDLMDRS